MSKGALYIRQDLAPGGTLPPFVKFNPPLPFPEPHFRGISFVPGLLMRLAWPVDEVALGFNQAAYQAQWGDEPASTTEIGRHLQRLLRDADRVRERGQWLKESVGGYRELEAHDLLMWVGENYYPTPEKFIDECVRLGINKRIPVSSPPTIIHARTMLFVAHPRAIIADQPTMEDGEAEPGIAFIPGIIGFAYLTRTIYTKPDDPRAIPAKMREWEKRGQVEIVEIGLPLDEKGEPIDKARQLNLKVEPEPKDDQSKLTFGQKLRATVGRVFGGGGSDAESVGNGE
jgi:hypothetical protein